MSQQHARCVFEAAAPEARNAYIVAASLLLLSAGLCKSRTSGLPPTSKSCPIQKIPKRECHFSSPVHGSGRPHSSQQGPASVILLGTSFGMARAAWPLGWISDSESIFRPIRSCENCSSKYSTSGNCEYGYSDNEIEWTVPYLLEI